MTESEQVKVYARTDFSDSDGKMVSRLSEFIKESKKNLQRNQMASTERIKNNTQAGLGYTASL